jgi:S-DNA-T family DNA segregation ATPase FtsK/SpoIIIE
MAGFWAKAGDELRGATAAAWEHRWTQRGRGALVVGLGLATAAALASHNAGDPSWNSATADGVASNWLGQFGADLSDAALQLLGFSAWAGVLLIVACGLSRLSDPEPGQRRASLRLRGIAGLASVLLLAGVLAAAPEPRGWAYAGGLGGYWGDALLGGLAALLGRAGLARAELGGAVILALPTVPALIYALGLGARDIFPPRRAARVADADGTSAAPKPVKAGVVKRKAAPEPMLAPEDAWEPEAEAECGNEASPFALDDAEEVHAPAPSSGPRVSGVKAPRPPAQRKSPAVDADPGFNLPDLDMLAVPKPRSTDFDESALKANAQLLEQVLAEFGVRGTIDQIRPGPVVTLYELVPPPA